MAIKVLIKRQFKSGNLSEVSQLLSRLRYSAMGQQGYISSETWSDFENPNRVVVVSMWRSKDDWLAWKDSPVRGEFEGEIEKLVEIPTQFEVYELGMKS